MVYSSDDVIKLLLGIEMKLTKFQLCILSQVTDYDFGNFDIIADFIAGCTRFEITVILLILLHFTLALVTFYI